MKVKKQSLIDWQVTENGKHVAWIGKNKHCYEVSCKQGPRYFLSFKEAKAFATQEPAMKKECLYKTAQIRADIKTAPAGLTSGQFVSVKHYGTAYNVWTGKRENLYAVSATQEFSLHSPILFENAMERFCL